MDKLKFEKMLKKESARDILQKHVESKITLNNRQLDVIIQKKKLEK